MLNRLINAGISVCNEGHYLKTIWIQIMLNFIWKSAKYDQGHDYVRNSV